MTICELTTFDLNTIYLICIPALVGQTIQIILKW